jgi:hypothetical protein
LNDAIISDVFIFDILNSMNEYFKRANVFLPRNIISFANNSEIAQNKINEIHNFRIRKENKKRDRILILNIPKGDNR